MRLLDRDLLLRNALVVIPLFFSAAAACGGATAEATTTPPDSTEPLDASSGIFPDAAHGACHDHPLAVDAGASEDAGSCPAGGVVEGSSCTATSLQCQPAAQGANAASKLCSCTGGAWTCAWVACAIAYGVSPGDACEVPGMSCGTVCENGYGGCICHCGVFVCCK